MDPRLQLLIDRAEIREVLEAYVHAVDRCDRAAIRDVYHDDSWDDHGPMKMTGSDFADACTDAILERWTGATHLLGQSRIRVDGDHAGAETVFYASLPRDAVGAKMLDEMVGRYIDKLERRDGVWRIKDRRTIAQWSTSRPMGEDFMRGDLFLAGQRDPSDIAHEVLGLKEGCARIAA